MTEGGAQEPSLQLLLRLSGVSARDTVLDVACGPGLVACAFAAVAQDVTGIDLTPAMLERAQALQRERGLANLTWKQGAGGALPFAGQSFSLVLTRYSFHHFLSPATVLAEMVRVCRPGGRVMVVDVTPAAAQVAAFDRFETLRDPSHVHASSFEDLRQMMAAAGLGGLQFETYAIGMELERQLASSFPNPGDADRIRKLAREDLDRGNLGVRVHLRGEAIHLAYPVTAMVGTRAS